MCVGLVPSVTFSVEYCHDLEMWVRGFKVIENGTDRQIIYYLPTIWHSNIYTIIRHVWETSEILPLSTVFLQPVGPVELVTTCILTVRRSRSSSCRLLRPYIIGLPLYHFQVIWCRPK